MKLWLVRHAKPLVEKGLCYGRLDVSADQSLTEMATDKLITALSEASEVKVLLTSPRQRTKQLANLLAQRLNLNLLEEPRLAEMDFGEWEGRLWADIPKSAIDLWTENFNDHAFGGGETTGQLLHRVWQLMQNPKSRSTDQLWVTHAGVIKAVQYLIRTGDPHIKSASDWPLETTSFGNWVTIDITT
ncbi:MAG: histidine phosphatase family protein [Rhodobacteraceae bacterium]|nr:histidine phosphatase family protein [Paracoccaceae bacterium]